MKFTIALCTRNRPIMLKSCIKSIQKLEIPKSCDLHLVVVENNVNSECKALVSKLMTLTPQIKFTYILEKKLGLSTARNTSLDSAISTAPDWICFIDDDEYVKEDWLLNYFNAINSAPADVYVGPVDRIAPKNVPISYKIPSKHREEHLTIQNSASTGNVIVKASFFNGLQHNYRFDEKYQFTGCEDIDMFWRIRMTGGVIRYVANAVVYETIPIERTTIKWALSKEFLDGNNTLSLYSTYYGYKYTIKKYSGELFERMYTGILLILWGTVSSPFSKRSIRYFVKGLKRYSWVFGFFSAFFKFNYQRYKKIEGN